MAHRPRHPGWGGLPRAHPEDDQPWVKAYRSGFYCPLGDGLDIEVNYRTASALLDTTQAGVASW
ncbi:hypothetical protein L3i22_040810 [Actinoplanes sp. L3-i22]|nr:hypothetical protein L3i22_040810 [Actinoplanes sp. L3-i22]